MHRDLCRKWPVHSVRARSWLATLALLGILTLATACNTSAISASNASSSPQTSRQVLRLPNVGAQDIYYLDPAQEPNANDPTQGPDPNSALALSLLYSGLVRIDQHLNVVPDQATWDISPDGRVYTFHLKDNLRFSDGTPITAQTYVYSLTRALLPALRSPLGPILEKPILGAEAVSSGKARTLAGVQAPDPQTLRITLTAPTPYFLTSLSNELFFPVNQQLIQRYGQSTWTDYAIGKGIGSGPFMIKAWEHNVKMVLIPNPYYYGPRPRLSEIDMIFVDDPATAFQEYRAGQFDLIWNIPQSALAAARGIAGFCSTPLLETDMLFFNTHMPPFDKAAVRLAFSYAIDRTRLAHSFFQDSVTAATTLIPPGMPDYQSDYQGLTFNAQQAQQLLHSAYPDPSLLPPITFSFPPALISPGEANLLASMWSSTLQVSIKLLPTELNAYYDELAAHQIQLGFAQWYALYPDPHDWLAPNLLSNAPHNNGQWQNQQFDQLIEQADHSESDERTALYQQAEQIALEDGAILPLDHETVSAIIPPWVHGITLNAYGLYVDNWSQVYLPAH